jgi:hypothetical protein
MAAADSSTLHALLPLLRQLRDIKGVREARPGVFQLRGNPFLQFLVDAGAPVAELKKAGGSGFDRYGLETAVQQRKLIDDAKRRAARSDED